MANITVTNALKLGFLRVSCGLLLCKVTPSGRCVLSVEQEVGGSSPPNCTSEINNLSQHPPEADDRWLPHSHHGNGKQIILKQSFAECRENVAVVGYRSVSPHSAASRTSWASVCMPVLAFMR